MKVYNIEIFQPDFTYRSSTQTSDLNIDIDYLDIVKNKIKLPFIDAVVGDYVRISTSTQEIDGIITAVKTEKLQTTISFKDFKDIFDISIYVDISQLATKSIEGFIADIITSNYINNSDELQNITGLSVSVVSGTINTTLDVATGIVNFYKDVVYSAFLQYNIVIDFSISTQQKKIVCTIGKNIAENKVIETRLPNILTKNIDLGVTRQSFNKLTVINEDNISEKTVLYLKNDGTISDTVATSDRILPVIFESVFASVPSGKIFSTVAMEKATTILKQPEYNNLIELEMTNDDNLIKPSSLGIGQKTSVIDNENQYDTILTGMKIGKTTTLIFGAVRKELTKKIKWRL